jgi:hypothetical protein
VHDHRKSVLWLGKEHVHEASSDYVAEAARVRAQEDSDESLLSNVLDRDMWSLEDPVFATLTLMLFGTIAHSESVPLKQTSEVRGQVVMLTSEFIVVASQDGTNIHILLSADATMDHTVKTGDRVEIRIGAAGRATAVAPAGSR